MYTTIFERFVSFRRIPMKIVIITALASYALQIGAILQGQPLYIIALYTLVPWLPLALFEGIWKYEHYGWIAVFAVVTGLQVGHLGEHSFQVIQLAVLNGTVVDACPPPIDNSVHRARAVELGLPNSAGAPTDLLSSLVMKPNRQRVLPQDSQPGTGPVACGVFGALDFETVHLVWDSAVWFGALWLLTKFPRNIWLWLAMIAASTHEVEHLFIGWIFFAGSQGFGGDVTKVFQGATQLWATTAVGNIVTSLPYAIDRSPVDFYHAGGLTGIMGREGLVEYLILDPDNSRGPIMPWRPFLHFGYNSVVVIPTLIGFLVQSRRAYNEYLAKALPELSEEQLAEATPKLERLNYQPGDVVVRQGEPADRFYIITKGEVEVVRDGPSGQEIALSRLGSGQYFGEIGLLHGGKRIATVRAVSDVEVMALDRNTFSGLMTQSETSKAELDRIVRQRVTQVKAIQSAS